MSESFAKLVKLANLVDFVKANSVNLAGFTKANLANLLNFVKLNLADFIKASLAGFARTNLAINSAANSLHEFIAKHEFTGKFNAKHKFTRKSKFNAKREICIRKTQIFQANSRKIYNKARIYTQNSQQNTRIPLSLSLSR